MSQSASELAELDHLIDALEREQAALAAGDADAVARIAAEKERLASALSSIREIAFPDEPLRSKARQAKLLNDSNGRVIALLSRHASARLAALVSSNPSSTYGPDGAPRATGPSRSFAAV